MQDITYAEFLGRFKIRQKIGQGGYGEVFRAYDTETKQYRAFKKIVLRRNEDPYSFLTEIEIQGFLAHPLVLKIFEFYVYQAQDKHIGRKVQIGIVSELGKASLHRLIRDKSNQFPIEEIINFAFHFTKLFAYFQDLNIVHRDIKPQNFVQVGPGLQCKLIDFGLCTHIKDIRHTAGSFAYMSPILKKMHTQKELKGLIKSNPYKNDVYSFGLTLYELITRQGPSTRTVESAHKLSSNVLYKTQNQKLAQIVQMMLEYEEQIRPDFNQLYNIFKKNFQFIEEDPVNQIDGYSEKDLAKMNCHERHAVIKKRIEFQQNMTKMDKTQKKKYEQNDFRKTNRFYQTEYQYETYIDKFERKQVHYVDKEMEEQVSRRKKRHFGNQKVILKQQSTRCSGKNQTYLKDESPKYQKTEQRYNRRYNQHERQHEGPECRIQNDKTVQIDKIVICPQQFQTLNDQNLDQISQKTVEIPVGPHTQVQQSQPQIQTQVQTKPNFKRFHWKMPQGISVTALVMMKGHIICGCNDGSLRVINPISKNKDIIYKIIGGNYSHEGSKITVITKDAHGMVWTASEDGKIIKWIRTYLFTELENEKNYTQKIIQVNKNGEKQKVKQGLVKLSSEVNKIVKLESPKAGITALLCYNKDRFGIGYEDGTVFVQWDINRFTHKKHSKAITSIKRQDDQIFTSSLDGTIVILDTKNQKLRNQIFKCPFGIRNFMLNGDSIHPGFFIVTVNGRGYMSDTSNGIWEVKDDDDCPFLDVKDAFFCNSEFAFTLISDGSILKNGEYQVDCGGGDVWSCLFWDENNSIAVGSDQGWVCLVSYD